MPQDCGLKCSIDFYRGELQRELDVQRGMWRPFLAMFPGIVVAIAGIQYRQTPHFAQNFLTTAAAVAALCVVLGQFHRQDAKRLKRRIDDLDATVKGS